MWAFLLAGVGGGWYGTELFEYARSSFVDGYAVEHVPAGCAQADSEYKNCLLPSSLLFIQTSIFKFFSPKIPAEYRMAPASLSKTNNIKYCVQVTKSPPKTGHVPSFACQYNKSSTEKIMSSSPPGFSRTINYYTTWPRSILAISTYDALSTYKSLYYAIAFLSPQSTSENFFAKINDVLDHGFGFAVSKSYNGFVMCESPEKVADLLHVLPVSGKLRSMLPWRAPSSSFLPKRRFNGRMFPGIVRRSLKTR